MHVLNLRRNEMQPRLVSSAGGGQTSQLYANNSVSDTARNQTSELFFQRLFSERPTNPGVFLGDLHGMNAVQHSLQKDILPALARNGVKILFLEMVKAEDQKFLEQFQRDGDKLKLRKYFVDSGWDKGNDPEDKNSAWVDQLVATCAKARDLGITLVGIDIKNSGLTRLETSNPAWRDVIMQTLANHPKGTRYAVFGGVGHSANYPFNQGVDRLLNIPSVDFAPQQEGGVPRETTTGKFQRGDGKNSDYIYLLPAN